MQRHFDAPMGDESVLSWLYNPVGRALLLINSSAYGPYGARVSDIEGSRRAAVLAAELRSKKISANDVPPALTASTIRTPYDGLPFVWDDKEQSIIFIGLQKGDRARQAFKY
jgi:hypothetical protein